MDIGLMDTVDVSQEEDNSTIWYVGYDQDFLEEEPDEGESNTESKKPSIFVFNTTRTLFTDIDIYELNRTKSEIYYPLFIILGCIVVLGVLCNIVVCYIYRCRSRRATSNFFVIFFAIFDMSGCLVGIPVEIAALNLPYTFDMEVLCKIMGFIETISVCSLCSSLICVAYDCYIKHCRPSDILGVKKARLYCVISVVVALVLSVPAFFVFRTKQVKTKYPTIVGKTCSLDFELPLWLRILYASCVLTTFTASLTLMSILYCLIAVNYWKQKQAEERGEKPSPAKRAFPKKHRFVREETSTSSMSNNYSEISRHTSQSSTSHPKTDPARVPLKITGIVKTNSLQASSAPPTSPIVQLHVKHTKQTLIFFVISLAFVMTMLPYVVVTILCVSTTFFHQFSSDSTEIAFHFCIRSYLLNYLVKPVVYIIFNVKFRKEVKHLFMKLWAFCTRTNYMEQQPQCSHKLRRSFSMGAPRSTSRMPIYRSPVSSS